MSKLYEEIYKLKTIVRKGWQMRAGSEEFGRLESDAEHTFSMTILALEIMTKEKLNLNQEKVLKMIAYHELGEIDFGDHTPFEEIYKLKKNEAELACITRMSREYEMPEILDIWLEFENQNTAEAKFVRKIDKLDAIVQSKIYGKLWKKSEVHKEFKNHYKDIAKEFKKYI